MSFFTVRAFWNGWFSRGVRGVPPARIGGPGPGRFQMGEGAMLCARNPESGRGLVWGPGRPRRTLEKTGGRKASARENTGLLTPPSGAGPVKHVKCAPRHRRSLGKGTKKGPRILRKARALRREVGFRPHSLHTVSRIGARPSRKPTFYEGRRRETRTVSRKPRPFAPLRTFLPASGVGSLPPPCVSPSWHRRFLARPNPAPAGPARPGSTQASLGLFREARPGAAPCILGRGRRRGGLGWGKNDDIP